MQLEPLKEMPTGFQGKPHRARQRERQSVPQANTYGSHRGAPAPIPMGSQSEPYRNSNGNPHGATLEPIAIAVGCQPDFAWEPRGIRNPNKVSIGTPLGFPLEFPGLSFVIPRGVRGNFLWVPI